MLDSCTHFPAMAHEEGGGGAGGGVGAVGAVVVVGAAVVAGVVVVEGTSVDVETVESEPLPQAKVMSMIARYMASTLMVRVCHPPVGEGGAM